MSAKPNPLAVRAQEILHERHSDGSLIDRENLAIRIARMEQREAAVAELVEADREYDEAFSAQHMDNRVTAARRLAAAKRRAAALAAFEQQP